MKLSIISYSNLVNILLFFFLLGILSIKVFADIILFLLMLLGIYALFKDKINPFTHKSLRIISILSFIYFFSIILSILTSGKAIELLHYASRDLYFLFTPIIALAIYKAKINFYTLILSTKLTLILMGILSLYQYSNNIGRPSWIMNADVFGNLMVMLLFISWVLIYKENTKNLILTIFSSIFGIAAITLSGTRGAWISFILLFITWLFILFYRKIFNKKIKLFLVSIFIIISTAFIIDSTIKIRTISAINEVINWYDNKNITSSSGQRLEMYKAGILAAKERPFFGYGYRNTNKYVAKFANDKIKSNISNFNHLHNAYINSLAFGGIVALLALLALLLIPLKKYWHAFKNNYNIEYAILGILLSIGYISFGMVNILFGDVFMNVFYVFFMAIVLPKVSIND